MQFEKLADGFGAVEAPRVDARGALYFSDIIFGGLYRRAADGGLRRFLPERGNIGGILFNRDGRLVVSGKGGLICFDPDSGAQESLLTHIEGRALDVVNDIHADADGNLYGGVIDYASLAAGQPPTYGLLFRLDSARRVTVLARDVGIANGIGFSPDGARLYHADTARGIRVHELDGRGALRGSRLFAELPGADGLAVDAEGGVWVACYMTAELLRFLPNGDLERRLPFAAKSVLSAVFGGAGLRDLYVTTADDFHDPVKREGAIYRARSDVAGQPLPETQF